MKVLFYLFFPGGGIGQYTHEQLSVLAQCEGLEVEAVTSPDFTWKNEASYPVWPGLFPVSHPWPPLRKAKFLAGQFISPRRCIAHAREVRADLVHFCNINHLSFPAWEAALTQAGIRVTAAVHDVRRGKAILHRGWEEKQLKAFYRRADALFVHSRAQVAALRAFAGVDEGRVHIVPPGVMTLPRTEADAAALREKWGIRQERVALSFGSVRDDKNLDSLMRALAEAPSAKDVALVVAGRFGGRHRGKEYYEDLVQSLGMNDRVYLVDRYLSDQDAGELFTFADWVGLTYDASFTSMSAVMLVSLFFRCPVLATPAPTMAEWMNAYDAGVVASGYDVHAIAEAVECMEHTPREDMLRGMDKLAAAFTWENNASAMKKGFEQIMQGGGA